MKHVDFFLQEVLILFGFFFGCIHKEYSITVNLMNNKVYFIKEWLEVRSLIYSCNAKWKLNAFSAKWLSINRNDDNEAFDLIFVCILLQYRYEWFMNLKTVIIHFLFSKSFFLFLYIYFFFIRLFSKK